MNKNAAGGVLTLPSLLCLGFPRAMSPASCQLDANCVPMKLALLLSEPDV